MATGGVRATDVAEERLQHLAALLREHATRELDPDGSGARPEAGRPSEPANPAFGSAAPNTTRSTRARTIAPAHIAHGSSVTYSVQPSRRHDPVDPTRLPQRQDLRVRGGIPQTLARVAGHGHDVLAASDDCADRHVARQLTLNRGVECRAHHPFVERRVGRRVV